MRRRTAGVISADELVPARIAQAETTDAMRVVRLLEPLITDRRRMRLKEVIESRLGSVTVVFDAPHDPHNGAAIVRSCEAFGVQRLHVVERPSTPFVVARSVSRGAEKWVDVTLHAAAPSLVAWARASGMPLVGAHPEGELEPEDLATLPRVAVVLGNEREGIRDAVVEACAHRVRVPMRGFV